MKYRLAILMLLRQLLNNQILLIRHAKGQIDIKNDCYDQAEASMTLIEHTGHITD